MTNTNHTKSEISPAFVRKKSEILSAISIPADAYTDKSPKGSIDAPIISLIDDINAIEGLVTTSSCSGRVAVFVEGRKTALPPSSVETSRQQSAINSTNTNGDTADGPDEHDDDNNEQGRQKPTTTSSPGGKGGGHWLYVSHDPVDIPTSRSSTYFSELCGLNISLPSSCSSSHSPSTQQQEPSSSTTNNNNNNNNNNTTTKSPRLVKLIFSPLILHVLCATLRHAKPLLAASINAGFRESGVHSLKILDHKDTDANANTNTNTNAGTMVGIRTMGLAFETVIGFVHEKNDDEKREGGKGGEVYVPVLSEESLGVMFRVVNERFVWNDVRRERLRREIGLHCLGDAAGVGAGADGMGVAEWEDAGARKVRKREQGLLMKRKKKEREEEEKRMDSPLIHTGDGDGDNIGDMFEENQ